MMAVLSRLVLDPRCREVQVDLTDCHRLHQRVMTAFPDVDGGSVARKNFGVLFRLETIPRGVHLLVQATVCPDWSRLPEGYVMSDWLEGSAVGITSLDPLLERIREGASFRFRLRANPSRKIDTKSGPSGERRHGRRVPLRQQEARVHWLARRATRGGFAVSTVGEVPDLVETKGERVSGWRRVGDQPQRITVESVLFEGRLRVLDATSFQRALLEGIGPAKSYGCGLLSVAPD